MNLALVFHNHQPVGQLPWAFEDVAQHCYEPFLEVLAAHPHVHVALHFSGPLLDWLCEHRPQTIEQLKQLTARGQVELLGGGFYEPILAIWPQDEQRAQLDLLSRRVEKLFGQTPTGAWLAERVWEPQLANTLRACDLEYTLADSVIFTRSGIAPEAQHGVYQVEGGLKIFPINQELRYSIPWQTPESVVDYLREFHARHGDDSLAVFADDGEKFGAWPGTFEFIYGDGWLEKFFALLEKNAAWLHLTTPQKYAQIHASLSQIELQAGSYAEMQNWSRGNWRNFLDRYPESRDIFDEVNRISALLGKSNLDEARRGAARDHLLRAQCNDAFWHGTFGGLYLRHLRQSLYAQATEAQVVCESDAPFARAAREQNGDCIAETHRLKIGARVAGGHLFLMTSKAARHNLLSTLRRHREEYLPDADIDWHARGALVDHFFGAGATPENFATARFPEDGDFASEDWSIETKATQKPATIKVKRDGFVWANGVHVPLRVEKEIGIGSESDEISVRYEFTNNGNEVLNLWHACEWNVAVTGVALPDRHYHADDHAAKLRLDETAVFESVTNPIVADRWLELWLEWHFQNPVSMWHVPIWTLSQKEGGEIERTHQSSAFVFHHRLLLAPGVSQTWEFKATVIAKRPL